MAGGSRAEVIALPLTLAPACGVAVLRPCERTNRAASAQTIAPYGSGNLDCVWRPRESLSGFDHYLGPRTSHRYPTWGLAVLICTPPLLIWVAQRKPTDIGRAQEEAQANAVVRRESALANLQQPAAAHSVPRCTNCAGRSWSAMMPFTQWRRRSTCSISLPMHRSSQLGSSTLPAL